MTTAAATLIDEYMPRYDVVERHERHLAVPPARAYQALQEADFGRSRVVRWLYRMRGLPKAALTLEGAVRGAGFLLLAERPGDEILLGLVGRFWSLAGGIRRVEPARFRDFAEPGYAVAAWNFHCVPDGSGTRLLTETRVRCTDPRSLRRFRLYWRFIGPFSSFIRRKMLDVIAAPPP